MADCLLSSLLCAEDNDSLCYEYDDNHKNVDDKFWGHGNHLNINQNQPSIKNHDAEDSVLDFPLQSDECLSVLYKKESEQFVGLDYLMKLRNGNLDFVARQQAVDWIKKVCSCTSSSSTFFFDELNDFFRKSWIF